MFGRETFPVCPGPKKYHSSADVLRTKYTLRGFLFWLDVKFRFLHTRFAKTYNLSADVYRTKYALRAWVLALFACVV